MFYLGITLLGLYLFSLMGVDLLPDVNLPHLIIQTEYSDAAPEEIENLITEPLESAVGSLSGVKKITSVSREGVSVISVDFNWGTDMKEAVMLLREKLDNMSFSIPREASRPVIVKADPSASPILTVSLSGRNSKKYTDGYVDYKSSPFIIKNLTNLKETALALYRRRLEQIDGVAQAVVTGGLEKEIRVNIKPASMEEYGITPLMISSAVKSGGKNLSSGKIMKGVFRFSLRTEGEYTGADEIANTVVKRNDDGSIVFIRDIADVIESFKERQGLTRLNGAETVGLLIYKEPESNTVDIARKVRDVLSMMNKEFPAFETVIVSDQSDFIESAIFNVKQEVIFGGLLATLVLFFFLGSLRNITAIALTIPASLLITIALMRAAGINFNVISLGGVAVGVGMLLDNAIIVIENVVRYREMGKGFIESVNAGVSEVAMPVVTATLTTIVVFLPLIFMPGIAGEIFRDQSYAIAFSLSASIVCALTLIPLILTRRNFTKINKAKYSSGIIEIDKPGNSIFGKIKFYLSIPFRILYRAVKYIVIKGYIFISGNFSKYFNRFNEIVNKGIDRLIIKYELFLEWGLNHKRTMMIVTVLLFLAAVVSFINIKKEFIPESAAKEFVTEVIFPRGTSLRGNAGVIRQIENAALKLKGVKYVISDIGRVNDFDFLNKENISVEKTALTFKLESEDYYFQVRDQLRKILNVSGGFEYSFRPVKTAYSNILNPSEHEVVLKIKSNELEKAFVNAGIIKNKIEEANIEGIKSVWVGTEKGLPGYNITIDREKCVQYGISAGEIADFLRAVVDGGTAAYFSEFDLKVGIRIQAEENDRNKLSKILSRQIIKGNLSIPISKLVNVERVEKFSELWRKDRSGVVYVLIDAEPGHTGKIIEAVNPLLIDAGNCQGTIDIGGANEEIEESFSSLEIALIISVLLMYMILAAEFESFVFPFIIILSVPLGLVGGIILLFMLGQSINIISIMGLIILVGIADNDAVVKVEFIIRKRAEGLKTNEAILAAGKDRFRPIVMNSLTVIFGLIPMIIGFGAAGTQLRISLAVAIAGGLVSSTVLTLIIIPIIYTYMEKLSKKKFYN